jgi:hypothetical protein
VTELAEQSLPEIPDGLDDTAASVADAAREIEATERSGFELVRERDGAPLWRRRERAEITGRLITGRLQHATNRVEQLHTAAERGAERRRAGVAEIEAWWSHHHAQTVEVIAARRERYRRERWDRRRPLDRSIDRSKLTSSSATTPRPRWPHLSARIVLRSQHGSGCSARFEPPGSSHRN